MQENPQQDLSKVESVWAQMNHGRNCPGPVVWEGVENGEKGNDLWRNEAIAKLEAVVDTLNLSASNDSNKLATTPKSRTKVGYLPFGNENR